MGFDWGMWFICMTCVLLRELKHYKNHQYTYNDSGRKRKTYKSVKHYISDRLDNIIWTIGTANVLFFLAPTLLIEMPVVHIDWGILAAAAVGWFADDIAEEITKSGEEKIKRKNGKSD